MKYSKTASLETMIFEWLDQIEHIQELALKDFCEGSDEDMGLKLGVSLNLVSGLKEQMLTALEAVSLGVGEIHLIKTGPDGDFVAVVHAKS